MRTLQLFITDKFQDAADGRTFPTVNPFSGEVFATCARGSAADVDTAVRAAREAFDRGPWPRMPRSERSALLKAVADRITADAQRLVALEVEDSGSTVRKAGEDVYLSARNLSGFAKMGLQELDEELEGVSRAGFSRNILVREPIGVVGAIIPWNFPLKMAIWKLGPALVAGNTIVIKPSEESPVTALELAALCREAGIPPGVVNIVTGLGAEAGAPLAAHPLVDKVAFTGSTAVGRLIMSAAAPTMKRLTLECGGKSANIVLDDADMAMAVEGALYAVFYHQGQCCEAGTRLLLPNSRADEFLGELVARTKRMRLGDPMNRTTDLGPLISRKQQERVLNYIARGKAEGAVLLTGGGVPADPACGRGWFVEPTIFDRVDNRSVIAREEIFGPVLSVIRYDSDEEAVRLANDSPYGLAGGVWSKNPDRAMAIARALRAGTVWINEWHLLHERAPFGGYGQSGFGREFGLDGLREYTEAKHVHIDQVGDVARKPWYGTVVPRS